MTLAARSRSGRIRRLGRLAIVVCALAIGGWVASAVSAPTTVEIAVSDGTSNT
jgi:hypothetical protein